MSAFKGNLYSRQSADSLPVVVSVVDNTLELTRDDLPVSTLLLAQLQMTIGGHDGKRLFFSDTISGTTLIVADLGILSVIEQSSSLPEVTSNIKNVRAALALQPKAERRAWAIFISVVLVAGIAIYACLDRFVELATRHIPPSLEKQLGDAVLASYRNEHVLMESGPEVDRARKIVDRLAAQLGKTPYDLHVYVEKTGDINAFAMPGGNIVVLSGLLKSAANDNEVAGVLGHEIGHVVHRHTLRSALHQAGLMVCISIIFQGQGHDQATWLANLIDLDALQFGRSQEDDADRIGVVLASKADYDPRAIISFFERLQKEHSKLFDNKMFEILSTHPCTPERIARIKREVEQLTHRPNAK